MAPSFDPRSVAAYADLMGETSSVFAGRWATGDTVDVSDAMTDLTLDIISRAMFSADAAEMTGLTAKALHAGQQAALQFGLLDMLPLVGSMRLAQKERVMAGIFAPMDGAVNRLIEQRRADPGRLDLLGRLVGAMDENTGAKLTPREVRDEVMTIF